MFSCLPSILMYFNQLQPTLPILRVSRCAQCSLPIYAITRSWNIFRPGFISLHPPQAHIFCISNQASKRNMEDATPPFIRSEYGKMLVYIQSGHSHLSAVCTARVAGAPAYPHKHHFQLPSARQLPSSTQTLGIAFPEQLGGAPEPKFWILDFILAAKLKTKNIHKLFNFVRSASPSQYAVTALDQGLQIGKDSPTVSISSQF